ncbi:GGDEF domain-containing protein [Aquisalimonas asiatica]|uniref:diguanylate cyclase n=1 Tax=Aquisalimonas asiatica TaxID=406100 RepID=A0A1H8THX5_9GAMM|nr:GGDEF domain-containing protein [Aquisalimonas asiatica]SEO90174.1 diguanylate cyclase (GGDEF) domain-containing protein [Aquisalimonas asiatica]
MRLHNRHLNFNYTARVYAVAGVLLIPFALYHMVTTGALMSLAVGGAAAAFLSLAAWIYRREHVAPLLNAVVVATAIGAVLVSIHELSLVGVYWAYPLVLVFYLLYSFRIAAIINVVFLLVATPVLIMVMPVEHVLRILSTLLLTSSFTFVFAHNLQRSARELEGLAMEDPLSGAGNRRQMENRLNEAVYLRDRYGLPCSLIVLDIDHFKRINDTRGHLVGDEILVQLAELLRHRLRQSDRVFRYGGEEFVVSLPSTRAGAATRIAEKLRARVAATRFPGTDQLTVSAGVAELRYGETQRDWLRRADAALYAAKAAGRNRVNVATAETTFPEGALGNQAV